MEFIQLDHSYDSSEADLYQKLEGIYLSACAEAFGATAIACLPSTRIAIRKLIGYKREKNRNRSTFSRDFDDGRIELGPAVSKGYVGSSRAADAVADSMLAGTFTHHRRRERSLRWPS